MNFYVSDTHALLWYLLDSSKLGANASGAFDEADYRRQKFLRQKY